MDEAGRDESGQGGSPTPRKVNALAANWLAKELYADCAICDGLGDVPVDAYPKGIPLMGSTERVVCPECHGRHLTPFGMTIGEIEKLKTEVIALRRKLRSIRDVILPSVAPRIVSALDGSWRGPQECVDVDSMGTRQRFHELVSQGLSDRAATMQARTEWVERTLRQALAFLEPKP